MIYWWVVTMGFAIAYASHGPQGVVGMCLGTFAGSFGAVVLAGACWFVGRIMAAKATPTTGTAILVLAAFVKFPMMVAAWWLASRLGPDARDGCSIGLVMSYGILVGWAMSRRHPEPEPPSDASSEGKEYV